MRRQPAGNIFAIPVRATQEIVHYSGSNINTQPPTEPIPWPATLWLRVEPGSGEKCPSSDARQFVTADRRQR